MCRGDIGCLEAMLSFFLSICCGPSVHRRLTPSTPPADHLWGRRDDYGDAQPLTAAAPEPSNLPRRGTSSAIYEGDESDEGDEPVGLIIN